MRDDAPPLEVLPQTDADFDPELITQALKYIPAENYDQWVAVGQALHSTGHPLAKGVWDWWSAQSAKYDASVQARKWAGFRKDGGRTLGDLYTTAHQAGWRRQSTVNGTTPHAHGPTVGSPEDERSSADLQDTPLDGSTTDNWPTMAPEAYSGLAGEIVHAIDPYTEADPVAVLLNILVGMGNLVGERLHAVVQHDRHPPRLNADFRGAKSAHILHHNPLCFARILLLFVR